jgi:hypothetical protein
MGQSLNMVLLMADSLGKEWTGEQAWQVDGNWAHLVRMEETIQSLKYYDKKIKERLQAL